MSNEELYKIARRIWTDRAGMVFHPPRPNHKGETLMMIVDAVAAAVRAEGWQPIDTAPKDGTRIRVANAHAVWDAEYLPVFPSGYRPKNPWASMMLNMDHVPREVAHLPPTHWMPLGHLPMEVKE